MKILTVAIIVSTGLGLRAQEIDPATTFIEEFFQIRQSLLDERFIGKPANVTAVLPAEGADTYSVDAAVALDLAKALNLPTDRLDMKTFVEYHYNTAEGGLSDSLMAGFSSVLGSWHDPAESPFFHKWDVALAWKQDSLVGGDGFIGHALWSPTWANLNMGAIKGRNGMMAYWWQPFAGIQVETGNGASADFAGGERLSVKLGVDATLIPLPTVLDKRLSIGLSMGVWSHVTTSGFYEEYDASQYYGTVSFDYRLDDAGHYSVGAEYRRGDNPDESKFDVDMWTLGFRVLF